MFIQLISFNISINSASFALNRPIVSASVVALLFFNTSLILCSSA